MEVVFESDDLLVINKDFGISVHNDENSVIHQLQNSYPNLYTVHRLDKETSGILVLAKNLQSNNILQEQWTSPSCIKKYSAILRGNLAQENGEWTQDLSDKAEGLKNPAGIKANRKRCFTSWKLIKANKYFSQIEATIKTGRQHQIRKHACLNKHSIVGDKRYGDKKYNKNIEKLYSISRMFLHCHYLQIDFNGQKIELSCPPSEDFDILFL